MKQAGAEVHVLEECPREIAAREVTANEAGSESTFNLTKMEASQINATEAEAAQFLRTDGIGNKALAQLWPREIGEGHWSSSSRDLKGKLVELYFTGKCFKFGKTSRKV